MENEDEKFEEYESYVDKAVRELSDEFGAQMDAWKVLHQKRRVNE